MSDAKICDRCGKFYILDISDEKDNVAGIALLDNHGREAFGKYDLCQKCRKELNDWLVHEPSKNKTIFKFCATCAYNYINEVQCAECINKSNWREENNGTYK